MQFIFITSAEVAAEMACMSDEFQKPVIDRDNFCIRWKDRSCELDNRRPFWLFERLNRRPGVYVNVRVLMDDVWPDTIVAPNTVQQAASRLRRALQEADMDDLVIDGETNPGHYALVIKPTNSESQ